MKVYKITAAQALQLQGKEFAPGEAFGPQLDGNNPPNWFISTQEKDRLTPGFAQQQDIEWVLELGEGDLIDHVAPIPED